MNDDVNLKAVRKFLSDKDIRYIHPFPLMRYREKVNLAEISVIDNTKTKQGFNDMLIKIISTRAFVKFINNSDDTNVKVYIDINIAGKRFSTSMVNATSDPQISEFFAIKLYKPISELLCFGPASISAVVVENGLRSIYGCSTFEWRFGLTGHYRTQVEIRDAENEPVGMIDIKIETNRQYANKNQIKDYIKDEVKSKGYVCNIPARCLPTPFHAVRFCHLLSRHAIKVSPTLYETSKVSSNFNLHNLISTKSGTKEEVAILLCSLLCGFGLNAFVSQSNVYTFDEKPMSWDFENEQIKNICNLPCKILYGYKKVLEPLVEKPSSNIENTNEWNLRQTEPPILTPCLIPCKNVDEKVIEDNVANLIKSEFSKDIHRNKAIETAIRPILYTFELEKLGILHETWSENVNYVVKNNLEKNFVLKMSPTSSDSIDPEVIFRSVVSKASKYIKDANAESFAFVLNVTPYCEGIYMTWTLLGVIIKEQ